MVLFGHSEGIARQVLPDLEVFRGESYLLACNRFGEAFRGRTSLFLR